MGTLSSCRTRYACQCHYPAHVCRKDVLEQKFSSLISSCGVSKAVTYQDLYRWPEGPPHLSVAPVVVVFTCKEDRDMVFNICRDKLSTTDLVITMDSRLDQLHYKMQNINRTEQNNFINHKKVSNYLQF